MLKIAVYYDNIRFQFVIKLNNFRDEGHIQLHNLIFFKQKTVLTDTLTINIGEMISFNKRLIKSNSLIKLIVQR